ncbi:SseB family protein, partial [Streptomyces goshikiensis]
RRVAEALAGDATLRGRLVRGLNLALLPAQAPNPPGEPLYTRP